MSWSSAAETRRRELPIAIALTLLTGGLAAIIIGALWPVAWAALMAGALIADAEMYRRADLTPGGPRGRVMAALAVWNFIASALYAALPGALWFDGEAAAAAAAMILWGAAVFRQAMASPGLSWIGAAGIAPPLASMIGAPMAAAAMSANVDWDMAAIAVVGGAALLAYVASARFAAMRAEAGLREAAGAMRRLECLERIIAEQPGVALYAVDRRLKLVSASDRLAAGLEATAQSVIGRALYDVHPWMPEAWRRLYADALLGRAGRLPAQGVSTASGERCFETEARPLRGADGRIEGALIYLRETEARGRMSDPSHDARLRHLQLGARAVLCEVDPAARRLEWFGDPLPIVGAAYTFEAFADGALESVFEEDRAGLKADWPLLLSGACAAAEARVRNADGKAGWVRIKPQAREDGRVSLLFKDVTQRKMHKMVLDALIRQGETSIQTQSALVEQALGVSMPVHDKDTVFVGGLHSFEEFQRRLKLLCDDMSERDALLREAIATLVTARKAADSASAAKSDFLANMSHELRTPLNAIIGYSEMLLEDAEAEDAESKTDLERVLGSARALLRLINEILDLSKIEAGRMELSLGGFDLALMIKEAVETVRPAAEKNANELVVACAPDLGVVQSDGFKLNQCLLNLLANANKFTNQGQVSVAARRLRAGACDMIEVAVKDTGIGLSNDQVKRLFQPFQQADNSTTRKYGGTGLGLAITKRTMQLLGGDVDVSSAPGEGAVFTLRFPAVLSLSEAAPEDRSGESHAPIEGIAVLAVDDEADARELVSRTLGRLGCVVRGAATAREALAQIRSAPPSIVLLDINLPDEDGWSVLSRLRADPSTARIPVIVVSVEDQRQRALALGACDQLVKPVRRDLLASAVARFARAPQSAETAAGPSPAPVADAPVARIA